MVISRRVVACTSRPVAFNGYPSTRGHLTGLRNKPQQKQTCQYLAVVYWQLVSLLMELSIDGENCSLTWCAFVAGFGKAGHKYCNTVWLQIFVVENFRNFRNYTVITRILFTKFLSQSIIPDTRGTR